MPRLPRTCRLSFVVALTCFHLMAQQEKGDKEIAFQGTVTVPFQNASNNVVGNLIPRFGYFLNARNFIGIENDDLFAKGYQAAGVSLLYRFYMGKRGNRFQPYVGLAPGFLFQRTPVDVQIVVTQASVTAAANEIQSATNLNMAQKTAAKNSLNDLVQAFQQGCLITVGSNACTDVPSGTRNVTSGDFQGAGELGIKFYLNRKFAFETSYRLQYVHQSALFAQNVYTVTNKTVTPTLYVANFNGPPTHNDGQHSGSVGFKESANNFILFGFSYVF